MSRYQQPIFGCLYNAEGVHSNPEKVDAIHAMPESTTVTELKGVPRCVFYLSHFIPIPQTWLHAKLSCWGRTLEFMSNTTYDGIFKYIKDAIINDTSIQYFDASCPVIFQIDTTNIGLGAALLHSSRPVAFTGNVLTEVQHCHLNIKCEMLTLVFCTRHFQIYLYGHLFTGGHYTEESCWCTSMPPMHGAAPQRI